MKIKAFLIILSISLLPGLSFAGPSDNSLFEQVRPIRIMKIELYDQGMISEGSHDLAIDTLQNLCQSDDPLKPKPEPFFDTLAGIYIYNNSLQAIRFDSVRFFITKLNKKSYKSKKLSLANIGFVDTGATTRLLALLLQAKDASKFLYPNRGPLPIESGATNVKFILKGINTSGQPVKSVGKIALVFRDVDRCE